jgi:hypothetical protein
VRGLRWLGEPRESRGYVMRWGCPGDECDGIFRTQEQAAEHGWVARVTGSHDVQPQRRFLRERNRQARQLRRRGRTR